MLCYKQLVHSITLASMFTFQLTIILEVTLVKGNFAIVDVTFR